MITLEFSYTEVPKTHTYEMTCVASGGSPFVKDKDSVFLNVASPSDMRILPDTPGSELYRDSEVAMLFRCAETRDLAASNIGEQVAELNSIHLSDKIGEVLFDNTTS